MLRWLSFFAGCFLILLLSLPIHTFAAAGNQISKPFETLQKRLIKDGFDPAKIRALYKRPKVAVATRIAARFLAHREASLNYDQFTTRDSIHSARRYMQKHSLVLEHTEKKYGVAKEVITAIILVESRLGASVGGSSTFNTLSTLALLSNRNFRNMLWNENSNMLQLSKKQYEKKALAKSKWAYAELKAFLKYTANERIDPLTVYGSYAGAVGIAQFMPSNILALATDGDNNGQINLFSHADAITSIANYLRHYGWHAGIDQKKAKKVIYRYNHSNYYVDTILKISELLKG